MYNRYLEAEVLDADPLKLVSLLYRGALEAVGDARRFLAAGAIRERSARVMKAWNILGELLRSLDRRQAGELGTQLTRLYVYMQQRLIDANTQQSDQPLAEVEKLLSTLHEAWSIVGAHRHPVSLAG